MLTRTNRVYGTPHYLLHLFPFLLFQHCTHHRGRDVFRSPPNNDDALVVAFCPFARSLASITTCRETRPCLLIIIDGGRRRRHDDASYNGGRGRSVALRNGHHRDTDEYERRASLSLSFSVGLFLLFSRFLALLSRSVRRFRSTARFTPSCSRRDRARTRPLHDHRLAHTPRSSPPLVVSELASRGSRCLARSFSPFRLSTMHASLSPPPHSAVSCRW